MLWLLDLIVDHANEQEFVQAWYPGDDLWTPLDTPPRTAYRQPDQPVVRQLVFERSGLFCNEPENSKRLRPILRRLHPAG